MLLRRFYVQENEKGRVFCSSMSREPRKVTVSQPLNRSRRRIDSSTPRSCQLWTTLLPDELLCMMNTSVLYRSISKQEGRSAQAFPSLWEFWKDNSCLERMKSDVVHELLPLASSSAANSRSAAL